jgi:2-polyprenyl-6-hydroxyphenyl methylase/3-demethylubiquinone-9 3-methyltransferase
MVFRMLPRGMHHWAQFARPDEWQQAAAAGGRVAGERRGMAYLPAIHLAWWMRGLAANSVASFCKPGAAIAQGLAAGSSLSLGKG